MLSWHNTVLQVDRVCVSAKAGDLSMKPILSEPETNIDWKVELQKQSPFFSSVTVTLT